MADNLREKGMQVRKALWGGPTATVNRLEAFDKDFSDFLTEQLFGGIWSRPGLPIKTRSFITMAALMALGRGNQLRQHMRGALNLGITPEEIKEMIFHLSQYSGVPTAVEAVSAFNDVMAERK